jgi:hypothetical protein
LIPRNAHSAPATFDRRLDHLFWLVLDRQMQDAASELPVWEMKMNVTVTSTAARRYQAICRLFLDAIVAIVLWEVASLA